MSRFLKHPTAKRSRRLHHLYDPVVIWYQIDDILSYTDTFIADTSNRVSTHVAIYGICVVIPSVYRAIGAADRSIQKYVESNYINILLFAGSLVTICGYRLQKSIEIDFKSKLRMGSLFEPYFSNIRYPRL